MIKSVPGQTRVFDTQFFINEINELIHHNLDKAWVTSEWNLMESGNDSQRVHPLIRVAYRAHQQIAQMVSSGTTGMTPEIWELAELAIKINALKRLKVKGVERRIANLTSHDFSLYRTARYELQAAGTLLQRGHEVAFIEECETKTPDILTRYENCECEIECKHKEPGEDQIDYIKSIYHNTQTARKQFSKTRPGAIFIEIEKPRFDEYETERKRLLEEIQRAMRNSSSISAIFLTSKIDIEELGDFVYRHRVVGILSSNARHPLRESFVANLISL